jgi:phospholipase D1/2
VDESDRYHRFRVYTPVTAGRRPIYVHAKVLVIDDRLLKVGSSNVNNRSLGFDTECDLSVEAVAGTPDGREISEAITRLRNDLLAEHLGVDQAVLDDALGRAAGSLIGAIEMLRTDGRTLVPFEPPDVSAIDEALLQENRLLDPERPSRRLHSIRRTLSSLNPWS